MPPNPRFAFVTGRPQFEDPEPGERSLILREKVRACENAKASLANLATILNERMKLSSVDRDAVTSREVQVKNGGRYIGTFGADLSHAYRNVLASAHHRRYNVRAHFPEIHNKVIFLALLIPQFWVRLVSFLLQIE